MDSNEYENDSTVTSTGETIVEEVTRLFFESDFVSGVQVSNPVHILVTTKGYDRRRRRPLYDIEIALMDKYPNLILDFNIQSG